MSTRSFSFMFLVWCYGKVMMTMSAFTFTSISNFHFLHFYLQLLLRNTTSLSRVNDFSHKIYIRRDPHGTTRGPSLSLYKSSSEKNFLANPVLRNSPLSGCGMISRPKGWGEEGDSGMWTPSVCAPSLYGPLCEVVLFGLIGDSLLKRVLMRAWWEGKFHRSLPRKTQWGCGCAL